MTESKVVNGWIEDAVREGVLDKTRQLLLDLLNKRFPNQVTPEVGATVNSQPDQTMLDDWFTQAIQVRTMAKFVKLLRK